jgi:hypothetical protein
LLFLVPKTFKFRFQTFLGTNNSELWIYSPYVGASGVLLHISGKFKMGKLKIVKFRSSMYNGDNQSFLMIMIPTVYMTNNLS